MFEEKFILKEEECSLEDLIEISSYVNELLMSRLLRNVPYEEDFIENLLLCGIDEIDAKLALRDFKAVCAIYLRKAEPLYIEDVEDALKLALLRNGFSVNQDAQKVLDRFIIDSFGINIPSLKSEEQVSKG